LPIGALRDGIAYPLKGEDVANDDLVEIMAEVGLGQFISRLDETDNWSRRLSVGEQQRIGFARAMLFKPDLLILDEATCALDEASEALLYQLLRALPGNLAIISTGHRSLLRQMHDAELTLHRAGEPLQGAA
jgi:putative ATP-binding cassette transporter